MDTPKNVLMQIFKGMDLRVMVADVAEGHKLWHLYFGTVLEQAKRRHQICESHAVWVCELSLIMKIIKSESVNWLKPDIDRICLPSIDWL